jgi:glycosyltransferase involved in cell wall biosynthesis
MLFSVIIPTYNRSHIIAGTIASVLAQTYSSLEVIVVDDGSTDNTKERVAQITDPRVKYFYKNNEERSIARNYGAGKASGEYLIFLDSDDRFKNDHLAKICEYIQKQERKPVFIFSGFVLEDPDGSVHFEAAEIGLLAKERLVYGNLLACSPVTVAASTFSNYYFNTDERLLIFEDWELWLRILEKNDLHCIPSKTVIIANHGQRSVLTTPPSKLKQKAEFLKQHIPDTIKFIGNDPKLKRKFISGILSYASLHIGMAGASKEALNLLIKTIIVSPGFVLKKRFFAIVRFILAGKQKI